MSPLLTIKDLEVHFPTEYGLVRAVDGVSFQVDQGRTVGVVGESGCGKSVTAMATLGLIQSPGRVAGGYVDYLRGGGERIRLTELPPQGRAIREIRGNEIAMIFQEPMTSLNPVFTVGHQIMESVILHQGLSKAQARERAVEMLAKVGIPLPGRRADDYPHHLSGGMRQRAMIAMALSCHPALLIADEPTTALDVTIQAQVLELMTQLRHELGTAIVLITHDLGVVASMADEVVVMYLGRVVEQGPVREIFHNHKHPYTKGLMASVPSLVSTAAELTPITGMIPDPLDLPQGCRFAPRCPEQGPGCGKETPTLEEIGPGHQVACRLYGGGR